VRVVFVSREVYPLGGGGIGQFVSAAAELLSRIAEVTVLTTSVFEERYQQLRARGDDRLPGAGVRFAFVREPAVEEAAGWYHLMQLYGHRILARLRELFPTGGPELIEFPDFLGEAFVTLQAAEAFDPFLTRTRICVRIHTTAEICEVLDGFLKRDLSSRALHEMERFSLAHADRLIREKRPARTQVPAPERLVEPRHRFESEQLTDRDHVESDLKLAIRMPARRRVLGAVAAALVIAHDRLAPIDDRGRHVVGLAPDGEIRKEVHHDDVGADVLAHDRRRRARRRSSRSRWPRTPGPPPPRPPARGPPSHATGASTAPHPPDRPDCLRPRGSGTPFFISTPPSTT